ncbi:MAG: polymerase beta domain protein region protein [Parcubacteria group bacterium GW2011_GWA2_47_21]|nr:MAG: polymerase beta domain protein region protein [Parcubacteria group bacterium GW2011_GWA2_47_21]
MVKNLEIIKEKASGFAEKHDLDLLVLFGSQVSGKTHKKSDYDFGFISAQPKSFEEQVRMEFELSEILKIGKTDLVDLKKAPPLLMKNVAINSVLFYQKKSTLYAAFKIYALKLFAEAKRLFEIRETAIQKFILSH